MNLKGKKIAILGFGMEGRDLASYLSKKGSNIFVHDIKERSKLETKGFEKFNFICGSNYLKGLNVYDIIFRSPGIYRYKTQLIKAEKRGTIISSATQLFFDECKGKIIGITGTKGKGTCANLIYKSLVNDGKDAYLLGNIGEPFLEKISNISKDTWVVLELSSFQLIDLQKSPHIGLILNITQDHLDWHKDLKQYINSKKNILLHQRKKDFAVISFDYKISRSFSKIGNAKKFFFSTVSEVEGSFVDENEIKIGIGGEEKTIVYLNELTLKGRHILENVTASTCASYLARVSIASIRKAIVEYKGYEHRLEFVSEIEGVAYYNDSAATGPHSVIAAVESFDLPITLILGGFDKGLDYEDFAKKISMIRNVKIIILIGNISKKLEKLFEENKFSGNLINLRRKSMSEIVKKAKVLTEKGGIVLLSPGASSFDMFESYKDRGNKFKEAVNALI